LQDAAKEGAPDSVSRSVVRVGAQAADVAASNFAIRVRRLRLAFDTISSILATDRSEDALLP